MSIEPNVLRILVVDEEPSVRDAYRTVLQTSEPPVSQELDTMELALFGTPSDLPILQPAPELVRDVTYASQGQEAHALVVESVARGNRFAVAFVDMRMPPGWDGAETIEHIWAVDPDVQIVVVTAYSDRSWDQVVARLGRSDGLLLLKKPFDPSEVRQLAGSLGEKWRLGRVATRELSESKRLAAELTDANAGLAREVVVRRAAEARLHRHAYYDSLTGLANRARLTERLDGMLERLRTDANKSFAVLFLDIDNFKLVNDSFGHEMGDRLLVEVAKRLSEGLRGLDAIARLDEDSASRLGGDEFVVILGGIKKGTDAAVVADRLLQSLAQPIDLGVQSVALSTSAGIAVATPECESAEALLRDADTAMYRAKSQRLRFAMFDPAMHIEAKSRLAIESDLRRAVSKNHISLVFQPIVHAGTRRIVALEALARWDHPDYPRRSPAEFIPIAEETGLIVPLGRWLLEEACRQLATLRAANPSAKDLRINVNVSRRQLLDINLAADVRDIIERTGIPADRVGLEITESAIIGDVDAALRQLDALKRIGVTLHLDDFGTGYSSLSCLQRFPLDVVKIDRAFVTTLGQSNVSASIVEAIVTVAHRLGIRVTIEGVETEPQFAAVQELGSDFAQGFLLHRPLSAEAISALFTAEDRLAPRLDGTPIGTKA